MTRLSRTLRLARLGGAFALWATACAAQPGADQPGASQGLPGDFVTAPIEMPEAGIFCPFDSAGQEPAPDTESGYILLMDGDRAVDIHSRVVPAQIGISFGVRIRSTDPEAGLAMRVTHPPIGDRGVTVETWDALISDTAGPRLFTFEYPRELQTGRWTFEVLRGEEVLLRQSFEVVPRDDAAWIVDACLAPSLMG